MNRDFQDAVIRSRSQSSVLGKVYCQDRRNKQSNRFDHEPLGSHLHYDGYECGVCEEGQSECVICCKDKTVI